ncbi:MAG: UvrD-helicase domain-containing protein [Myxococcota bacterium]
MSGLPRDPSALTARFGLTDEQAAAVARRGCLVVVSAGAGTGKTTTMASRYVDTALLLAEEEHRLRPGRPPRPRRVLERIAAVTFTELAAGELRARIGGVFERVAPGLEAWPALRRFAEEAARLEGDLPIGTIHALCGRLLRRMAFTGAVTPDFQVLDELDRGLLRQAALDDTFDAVADDAPALLERLLAGRDQAARLRATLGALVDGLTPEQIGALAERSREEVAREAARLGVALIERVATRPEVRDAVEEADLRRAELEPAGPKPFAAALDAGLRWVRGQGSASLAAGKVPAFRATERRLSKVDPGAAPALERFVAALERLRKVSEPIRKALDDEVLDREHAWTRDVARVALRAARHVRHAKDVRGAVDFDDLERLALLALRTARHDGRPAHPFDEILVDEFQDTSARQVAVLRELSGPEMSRVFAVGDAKQSIYRFRGADVAVFNRVAEQAPGGPAPLTVNRRSTEGVMAFVNALFARVFPERPPPEAPWVAPMQRLDTVRADEPGAPLPPLVVAPWWAGPDGEEDKPPSAEELRRRDAEVTADVVTALMARLGERRAELGVLLRAVRGARRVYADAIADRGVPVAVEAGGTFARDGAAATGIALLRALALPGHAAAWVATLRGPLVGLDDDLVARLATRGERAWPERVETLAMEQPLLVAHAGPTLEALVVASRASLSLAVRARRVVEAAGLASRQLDKLLDLARDLEQRGLGPLEVVEWFEALAADDKEKRVPDPPGEGVAVRALTVHASKGLEFPVVVASQLGDPLVRTSGGVRDVVDDGDGTRVALSIPDAPATVARTWNLVMEREREEAEQLRLLYVALTRARDHLVLPLPVGLQDGGAGTAAGILGDLLSGLDLEREGPQDLPLPGGERLPVLVWPWRPSEGEGAESADGGIPVRRPVRVPPVSAGPATWSITRLASLAFCPAYHAQAPVAPWPSPIRPREYPDPPPQPGDRPTSSAERGTLVHRWFEQAGAAGSVGDAPLPPALAEEGDALLARLRAVVEHPSLRAAFAPSSEAWPELPLEADRDGLILSGTLDRLALSAGPDGRLVATVVDFKTGRTGFPGPGGQNPAYLEAYRFQIAAYAWMLGELLGQRLHPRVAGRLAFVDLGEVVSVDLDLDEARGRVDRVLAEIRRPGSLPPNHAACGDCRMQGFCAVARS